MKSIKFLLLLSTVMLLGTAAAETFLSENWNHVAVNDKNVETVLKTLPEGRKFKLDKKHFADLDKAAGKICKVYDKCVVHQEFELDSERKIGFGMGADWWFEVYLNGKKIYATPENGNGYANFGIDNHTFYAMGKKGRNKLAILVTRGLSSAAFYFAEQDAEDVDPVSPLIVTVDKNKIISPVKIMNAINNGPVKGYGWNPNGQGNMQAWQELKIPYGRTHDSSFCNLYGGEFIVDVHRIFRDFSKDPYDPASYSFKSTDRFLKMIEEGGTKVFYRLGAGIEHTYEKYGTRVPPDFKKWAVICEHIIRHYTEGWANGFKMDIKYWEIWNEPDLLKNPSPTWQGTPEQFFEFYRTVAAHLKKCFPHLKIGGPALAGSFPWMRQFLAAISKGDRVPLDFFSWHIYLNEPHQASHKAKLVRQILDEYGYTETESILNEWNYVRNWSDSLHRMSVMNSHKGAAVVASVMAECQNTPVDMLMYYDGRPGGWNGLFAATTYKKQKTYYVFKIWAKLRDLGKQISLDYGRKKGLYGIAATDGKKIGIMLARYFERDDLPDDLKVTLRVPGVDLRGVKVYTIDGECDLADSPYRMNESGDLVLYLKANSVVYIEK